MRFVRWIYAGLLCVPLVMSGARAEPRYSQIELIGASAGLGDGQPILLGVRIEPRPGWKTYWRAPGESGLPPVFTFLAHDNSELPQIRWPAPKRLRLQGQESYGYDGTVIFPFHATPQDASQQMRLTVRVDYAVCLDICVPELAELTITIPPGPAQATSDYDALRAALARVPLREENGGFARIHEAILERNGSQVNLRIEASARDAFNQPDLFADGPDDLLFGPPHIDYAPGRGKAVFRLPMTALDPARPVPGQTITLTLVDGEFVVEKQVKLAEPP